MSSEAAVSAKALSKVNLLLRIKGARPDGYHEIETLFFPLENPCDKITLEFCGEGAGLSVSSSSPDVPCGERNLCWKAVAKYGEAAKISVSCKIFIEKNIPVAGGMGGGSSDAAAVLKILNAQYKAFSENELAKIALSIGADVPFFLNPEPSLAGGVGEELEPAGVPAEPPPLLVASPLFPVRAAWAYKHADKTGNYDKTAAKELVAALKARDWEKCAALIGNDLAPAVFRKFPLLRLMRAKMLETGALRAELSGSGPALFALYKSAKDLRASAGAMRGEFGPPVALFENCGGSRAGAKP